MSKECLFKKSVDKITKLPYNTTCDVEKRQ
jgi:hypothetical protein